MSPVQGVVLVDYSANTPRDRKLMLSNKTSGYVAFKAGVGARRSCTSSHPFHDLVGSLNFLLGDDSCDPLTSV